MLMKLMSQSATNYYKSAVYVSETLINKVQ